MLQQWDSKILNNIKTALKNLYIFCTQNIFSLAFTKIRYLKKWRSLLIKYLTENSDKHQINMDKAHQIFHINKWINKPTESKPLAYVNQHVHQSQHPSFLWKCSIYDPLSLKINCKWHINSLKDLSMYLPFGKTHPS